MGLIRSAVKKVLVAATVVVIERAAKRIIRKVAGRTTKAPTPPSK
jgi:hypothetical protein